jgi:hypothetical protein
LKEIERRLDDMRTSQLALSRIGSGGLEVADSGQIVFIDADGTTHRVTADQDGILVAGAPVLLDGDGLDIGSGLVVVDDTGLTVGSAPVVIDSDGLDIGNGLVVVDSDGLRVGTDVEIDATGLHVEGGLVQGLWFYANRVFAVDTSLGTSFTTIGTLNIDPPSWVEVLAIEATGNGQMGNVSGSTQNFILQTTIEGETPAFRATTVEHNTTRTHSAMVSATKTLSPAGQDIDVTVEARVNSGTNATNAISLNVQAFGVRTAFT